MGCCTSTDSSVPLNAKSQASTTAKDTATKKEDKIELAFKVKRANIFTEGVDLGREAYIQKRIPKSEKQMKVISKRKCGRGRGKLSSLIESLFYYSECYPVQLHFCIVECARPE
jgi:hypothetical protein